MGKIYQSRLASLLFPAWLSLAALSVPATVPAQTIRKVDFPDGSSYGGWPIVFRDSLYMQVATRGGARHLAVFDDNGGLVRVIPNPDDSKHGYMGYPILFKDKLCLEYQDSASHFRLAQFDGTRLDLVPTPAKGSGMQCLPTFAPIRYDDKLYFPFMTDSGRRLGCFDGREINLYSMQSLLYGVNYWTPFVYQHKLYFPLHHGRPYLPYHYEFPGDGLAQFDGKAFAEVAAPDRTAAGYEGAPVEYKQVLYFSYANAAKELQLARLEGGVIRLVPDPDSAVCSPYNNDWRPILYNDKLYLLFATRVYTPHGSPISRLAEFDGRRVKLIANPAESYYGVSQSVRPVEYDHKLYMQLFAGERFRMGVFDGQRLRVVPDLPGFNGGYRGAPVVYKGKLYFKYATGLAAYDGEQISLLGKSGEQHQSEDAPLFVYKDRLFVFVDGGLAWLEGSSGK